MAIPYVMQSDPLEVNDKKSYRILIKEALLEPYVWVFAFFIGLFHWTNYWDFVIYYVMGGFGIIYCNYLKFSHLDNQRQRLKMTGLVSFLHAVWVWIWGGVFALPFTLQFETMVRDIYEKEYARSNTMFKLTYQAFIMFGILMGYAFVRLWMEKKHRIRKMLLTVGFVCFAGCCCYIGTAVHAWFGQVWDKKQDQGLDATVYLEK